MRKKLRFNQILKRCTAFFLALFMMLSMIPTAPVEAATTFYDEAELKVLKTSKEYDLTPAGVNKKGVIYEMKLDGTEGFCLDAGKHASSGKRYAKIGLADEIYRKLISYALYDDIAAMHIGFTVGKWSESNYALAQALVWGYAEGCSAYETAILMDIIISDVSEHWCEGKAKNPDFLKMVSETWVKSALNFERKLVETVYVYDSGIGGNQRILSTTHGTKPLPKYDEVSAVKSYTATDSVSLSIHKIDKETSKPLSNISFDLYKDNVKVTTVTTDSNGNAFYTFKEESTKTASSTKEYCSNYHELSIPNQNHVNTDYTSKEQAQADAEAEALAKAKTEAEKLYSVRHTYKAVETKTKEAYYLNPATSTQSTSYASGDGSGTVTFHFTNTRQMGSVEITKIDSETEYLLDGSVYGLYAREDIVHPDGITGVVYAKDSFVGAFPATGTNGKATLNNLYLGKYYVKEITAPAGYVLSTKIYDIELIYAGQNISVTDTSAIVVDKVQRGSIEVFKLDKELSNGKNATIYDSNKDGAQGDASIVGATYGLYAKEDILHPDGTTGVVTYNNVAGSIHELKATKGTDLEVKNRKAKKDALLATIKTDENGEFGFENLYNGRYYIKEIKASEGYLLDKSTYDIDLSYTNQNESVVVKTNPVYETVKKQAFDLFKVGQAEGSSELIPLKDVEFTVKLESDVIRLGWDYAPIYDVITTQADGSGSSIELPYGTYRVRETKGLENYYLAEDFFVTVNEDSRAHQSFSNNVILNKEFSSLIKIVKKDADTGKTVAVEGAKFKVKALTDATVDGKKFKAGEYIYVYSWNILNGFKKDTWTSNAEGYVFIDEKLGTGIYQIEEVTAPNGYLLSSEPVEFKVGSSVMYEIGPDEKTPVITVVQSDVSVKGQITVEKRGEVLTGFKDGEFIYEEKALSGAKYNIIAKKDIVDPSNDGTVLYAKDTVIETLTTDENGQAVSSKLPLGVYEVVETEAPAGMILNSKGKTVELKYADENTPVVFENVSFINERQKVKLDLNKIDFDEKTPIADAEFTIYANKDILNYEGEVILLKDAVVTTAVSDKDGNIAFNIDLPVDVNSGIGDEVNAMFYMKETKRPLGYATLNAILYLDTTYQGQKVKDLTISYDLYNEMTRVAVSKTDIVTGKPVIGAELSIIPLDEDGAPKLGETFATWITNEEPYYIEYLPIGSYMLVELSAPTGYEIAESIRFEITDTNVLQKVEMKDAPILTDIQVNKVDSLTKEPVASKDFLFGIYSDKECTQLITVEHANKETGTVTFTDLRYGTYYIKELEAPKGYKLSDEVKEIVINDELEGVGGIHSFVYENTLIPVPIVKTGDSTSVLPFLGLGIFGLFAIGFAIKKKKI